MKRIRKMILKPRVLIVLVLVSIALYGYFWRQRTIVQKQQEDSFTVTAQDLEETLSLSGEISADEIVTLRFQSAGRLSWVGVKEGDTVKKFQGIASLDQRDLQMRMKKYLNTYEKTRSTFDQLTYDNRDVNIGGLTKDQREAIERTVEQAQLDLNNTVIDVEIQNLAAQYAYLYSPIEGIVVQVTTPYAGVNVSPTSSEFIIVNPDTIFLEVSIDQTDVGLIHEGDTGEVTLDAFADETFKGTVERIDFSPKEDESGTAYAVRIALPVSNEALRFRLGMTGDISFIIKQKKNALSVPLRYIKSDDTGEYVRLLKNGTIERQAVKTGDTFDTSVAILSGLKSGDVIVQ